MNCHYCGATMKKANRPQGSRSGHSHSFSTQPQYYVCPVDKSEVKPDENGHLKRADALSIRQGFGSTLRKCY